jgi:hypothetical protein
MRLVNKTVAITAFAATVVLIGVSNPAVAQGTDDRVYVVTHVDVLGPAGAAEAAKMLRQFAVDSRNDPGYVRLEVLREPNRLNHFTIVEVWRTQQDLNLIWPPVTPKPFARGCSLCLAVLSTSVCISCSLETLPALAKEPPGRV